MAINIVTASHRLVDVPLGLELGLTGEDPLHITLDHLPCPSLVRALALALMDNTNARGSIKTNGTARTYKNAIRRFAMWLDATDFDGDLGDLTLDHIYEYGMQEDVRHERRVRSLLRWATLEAGVSRTITDEVRAELDTPGVSQAVKRSSPLRAYTFGEYERLVSICKEEITQWEASPMRQLPTARVTVAFRVLIGFELGLPAESINRLRVGGLEWLGDRYLRVSYIKKRGAGPLSMRYRTAGPWSGPRLLERWISATEVMRSQSGSDALWVAESDDGGFASFVFSDDRWQVRRRGFVKFHNIQDDDGVRLVLDLRRLRTTWHQRKTKQWHGAVNTDPNHSATVEGDRYLSASADPDAVASTVESAQHDLLTRAKAVALVLSDDHVLADSVDDPILVASRSSAPTVHGWDMFAAACRDPYSSPFSPKGQFCTATVWSCLVCPLAVITPSKLPALLRLEDYLLAQSQSITQDEWLRVYGAAWVQLTTRIFPKFTDATLSAAREKVENDLDLPLPLEPYEAR